jgi:hypothetical protein
LHNILLLLNTEVSDLGRYLISWREQEWKCVFYMEYTPFSPKYILHEYLFLCRLAVISFLSPFPFHSELLWQKHALKFYNVEQHNLNVEANYGMLECII